MTPQASTVDTCSSDVICQKILWEFHGLNRVFLQMPGERYPRHCCLSCPYIWSFSKVFNLLPFPADTVGVVAEECNVLKSEWRWFIFHANIFKCWCCCFEARQPNQQWLFLQRSQVTLDRVEGRKVFLQGGDRTKSNIWDGFLPVFGQIGSFFLLTMSCHLGISGMKMMCFLLSIKVYILKPSCFWWCFLEYEGETLHFVVCRCWADLTVMHRLLMNLRFWSNDAHSLSRPFWGHMLVEKDGALLKTCEGNALFVELKNTWLVSSLSNRYRDCAEDLCLDRGSPESFGGKGAAWIVCFYFEDGWGHIWAMNVRSEAVFVGLKSLCFFEKICKNFPKKFNAQQRRLVNHH